MPQKSDCITLAVKFGLSKSEAMLIFDEIKATVETYKNKLSTTKQ